MTNAGLSERQQAPTVATDVQIPQSAESAEASRRSSTSTQNTDTLTPTNTIDMLDSQETIVPGTAATMLAEPNYRDQDVKAESGASTDSPPSEVACELEETTQKNQTAVSTGKTFVIDSFIRTIFFIKFKTNISVNADYMEKKDITQNLPESQDEIKKANDSEISESKKLAVPPMRKISRFLVSPVVEQKSVVSEGETTIQHQVVEQSSVTIKQEIVGATEMGESPSMTENIQTTKMSTEELDTGLVMNTIN